jgi:hypothetical protein
VLLHSVQTKFWNYWDSFLLNTGDPFPRGKATGARSWLLPAVAEVKGAWICTLSLYTSSCCSTYVSTGASYMCVRMLSCVSNECVCILPILPSDFVAWDTVVWSISVARGVRARKRVQRVGCLFECFILEYMASLCFWIQSCIECRDSGNLWEEFCRERNEDLVKMINTDICSRLKQWSGMDEW